MQLIEKDSIVSECIISAHSLTKYYAQQAVVDGISFHVFKGQCCGILGPNGAGKTTTLRMLIGNTPPSSGTLSLLGYQLPEQAQLMRAQIGVVPQQDSLDPDFSVTQNLLIYGRYFGLSKQQVMQRIPELLEFSALESKAEAKINSLSGGMQRRLSMARALVNQPNVLILDEPTTGLDPQARQLIWQRLRRLKQQGLTLILTTHYMEEAERLCDWIIVMDKGKILDQGSPTALVNRHIEPQVVEIYDAETWSAPAQFSLRYERIGDTAFYYGVDMTELLNKLKQNSQLRYLHRPANLEDVFLKLTGRELHENA
jgi:lipooligosaccharide transport system ATP-binding protein